MKKKVCASALFLFLAAVLFFYAGYRRNRFRVYDEFGIERRHFPYVQWGDFSSIFGEEVSEILDYKTFRTKSGAIVMLHAASPVREKASTEFLKKNIHRRPVVIAACGAPADYTGVISAVVFYGGGAKCLNKDLYDEGFIDVEMTDEFLKAEEWFNAQAD